MLAVVSAFRPAASLQPLVQTLNATCDVVIVDDGSGPGHDEVLAEAATAGARVVRSPENAGIAAALNTGLRIAVDEGYDAVLTFDQDSSPQAEFAPAMIAAFERFRVSAEPPVGVLVPEYFADVRQACEDGPLPRARRVIQSGMLIPAATMREIGFLDERLFIDLVDTEYELRCLSCGREVYAVAGLRLAHQLGRVSRLQPFHPLPWPAITTMVSTPFRYYYRARNRAVITRRYIRRFPARVVRDAIVDAVYLLVVGAAAHPRRPFRILVRAGARDGRAGRLGRMPQHLQGAAAAISWPEAELPAARP